MSLASHYSDDSVLGHRAVMRVPPGGGVTDAMGKSQRKKATLTIERLQPQDQGLYKCRTDFKRSPTRNYMMELKIMGKGSYNGFINSTYNFENNL